MRRYLVKATTASTAESLVMCGASHVLPQHESYTSDNIGGTEGHSMISDVLERKFGAALKLEDSYPGLLVRLNEIMDGVSEVRSEAAFVVNVKDRTSVYLGTNIGREYEKKLGRPLGFYEFGCSVDADGIVDSEAYWVRDWKFGTHSSWWQLFISGMAVLWQPANKSHVEVDAGFVHIEGRSSGDGDGEERDITFVNEDTATLYMSDLDERADDLVRAIDYANTLGEKLAAGVDASSIKTVEGKWCKYCGAYPHCPSKWKLVKSMLGIDIAGSVAAMTLADCGSAWIKLGEIEKNIIKKSKEVLKERMLREGAFPIDGTNKMIAPITMPGRPSLDRPALAALLREHGVTQDEINGIFKIGEPYVSPRLVNANGPQKKKRKAEANE